MALRVAGRDQERRVLSDETDRADARATAHATSKSRAAACRGREDAEGTTRRGELQSLMGVRHERLDVADPQEFTAVAVVAAAAPASARSVSSVSDPPFLMPAEAHE